MNTCPICGKEHDGSYGSGKFCSKHCRYVYIGKQTKNHVCNFPKIRNAVNKKPWGTWKCCWCEEIFETKLKLIEHKKLIHKNHPAWNKGLTKETDERIKKYSKTFSERLKAGKYNLSHHHSKETKELLSKKRSEYLASSKNAGGFRDVGWYEVENINHKKYVVRGTWEYNVALKLNEQNILWERNHYVNYFLDEIKRTYNPDFYLPESNEYIEVKGYFSEKDKIKMKSVVEQNKDIKIHFMFYNSYLKFIQNQILIYDVPLFTK